MHCILGSLFLVIRSCFFAVLCSCLLRCSSFYKLSFSLLARHWARRLGLPLGVIPTLASCLRTVWVCFIISPVVIRVRSLPPLPSLMCITLPSF